MKISQTRNKKNIKEHKSLELSSIIIVSYLIMICLPLILNIATPILLEIFCNTTKVEQYLILYKESTTTYNQNLSALSGIVGMVVGWFFKGKTDKENVKSDTNCKIQNS